MKIMSKTLLTLGAGLCLSATVSAQNISVGNAAGVPGGGTTPVLVPVTFTRNAATPVADFAARVNYNTTNLDATVAAVAPAGCSVNDASGFVTVTPPAGQTDLATAVLCNITFTIAGGAPAPSTQTLTMGFTPSGACIDSNVNPVTCTLTNGAITVNTPVGNTPPNISYNPTASTLITYSGGGTAAPIVATPSGGTGSGAAATTTVGACTITGGGAAFPTTNIAQLSFVGATVTPQNIVLPNCVPQGAEVNATLTCPQSLGGAAATNQVWPLRCPAAAPAAVPPVLNYNPASGSSTNVAASTALTINVGCPTDGAACTGSGTGLAATSRLESLGAVYTGLASPSPTMACAFVNEAGGAAGNPLDFVALAADPGDIRCTCPANTTNLPTETFRVTVQERRPASGAVLVARTFDIVCGAPPPPVVCGTLNLTAGTLNLTQGAPAANVVAVSLTGASNGVDRTVACTTSAAPAGSTFTITTNPTPLTVSTSPNVTGNILAACTNTAQTAASVTMTCTNTSNTANCATAPSTFVLNCPGQGVPPPPVQYLPVPALNEQGRILLAALVLLMGLGVVGFRMRG